MLYKLPFICVRKLQKSYIRIDWIGTGAVEGSLEVQTSFCLPLAPNMYELCMLCTTEPHLVWRHNGPLLVLVSVFCAERNPGDTVLPRLSLLSLSVLLFVPLATTSMGTMLHCKVYRYVRMQNHQNTHPFTLFFTLTCLSHTCCVTCTHCTTPAALGSCTPCTCGSEGLSLSSMCTQLSSRLSL